MKAVFTVNVQKQTCKQVVHPALVQCESCKHYIKSSTDPRCRMFPIYRPYPDNWYQEPSTTDVYIETSVARFNDYDLCGPEAKYYERLEHQ